MATQVDICNLALQRLGAAVISTINDSTKNATLCKAFWDYVLNEVLEAHSWGFTKKIATLDYAPGFGVYQSTDTKTITGITSASPPVVTATAHGFLNGQQVYIYDVAGMTEVNNRVYVVSNKADDTFELLDMDGTHWTTYTSGGSCYREEANSDYSTGYTYKLPGDYLKALHLQDENSEFEILGAGGGVELITNGTFEADSNWSDWLSPTVNERSTTQVKTGTYSRKLTADSVFDGLLGDRFTTKTGSVYTGGIWVYPDTTPTTITVAFTTGSGSGDDHQNNATGMVADEWNYLELSYTETGGGPNARAKIVSTTTDTTGTWYVDDLSLKEKIGSRLVTTTKDAVLTYTSLENDTTNMKTRFINALAWRLAAELALPISKKAATHQWAMNMYASTFKRLSTVDARIDQKHIDDSDTWITAGGFCI